MKLFISADIEGIAGITHWDEATPGRGGYDELRDRMTAHVAAACEGALAAGATGIVVKDAHDSGRNLLAARLPRPAQLARGWSGHPLAMVDTLDASFDAVAFIGYHAGVHAGGNPLAHTLSSSRVARLEIAGRPVAEFHLFGWAAGQLGVPVVLVSGDEDLCAEVRGQYPSIHTVPVSRGVGAATVSLHPDDAADRIREGLTAALQGDLAACVMTPPVAPVLELRFTKAALAYRASFFPGVEQLDPHTVRLAAADYFEILRALEFLTGP